PLVLRTLPIAAAQHQPVVGGILQRVRLLEQLDALLEGGRGPLSIAGQIKGVSPAAGQRGPQWGAGDVREHPLVQGSRFLIRKATLGIFGRLDANRDGLLPMARLHEMAGEVDRGDARQSAQYLGGLFVQPPSLGSNKVVVNRIATEDVPEIGRASCRERGSKSEVVDAV